MKITVSKSTSPNTPRADRLIAKFDPFLAQILSMLQVDETVNVEPDDEYLERNKNRYKEIANPQYVFGVSCMDLRDDLNIYLKRKYPHLKAYYASSSKVVRIYQRAKVI